MKLTLLALPFSLNREKHSKNYCAKFEIKQKVTSERSPRLRGDADRQRGKKKQKNETLNQIK
jgi:hypothetical protein